MKKITRRSFLKASAAAMVASGLAACGGSASSTAVSSVASAAGSAAAAGKGTIGILMPSLNAEFFCSYSQLHGSAAGGKKGYTGNIQGSLTTMRHRPFPSSRILHHRWRAGHCLYDCGHGRR